MFTSNCNQSDAFGKSLMKSEFNFDAPSTLMYGSTLIDDAPLPLNDHSLQLPADQQEEDNYNYGGPFCFDHSLDDFDYLAVRPQHMTMARDYPQELAKFESITCPAKE